MTPEQRAEFLKDQIQHWKSELVQLTNGLKNSEWRLAEHIREANGIIEIEKQKIILTEKYRELAEDELTEHCAKFGLTETV